MFQKFSFEFWIVVAAAVVIRLLTEGKHSIISALLSVFSAVFTAVVFTHGVLDWLRLDPETYLLPIGALLALTGQGLTKLVITYTNSPLKIIEALKAWRGK